MRPRTWFGVSRVIGPARTMQSNNLRRPRLAATPLPARRPVTSVSVAAGRGGAASSQPPAALQRQTPVSHHVAPARSPHVPWSPPSMDAQTRAHLDGYYPRNAQWYVKQWGPMRTGTNYLRCLLYKNFDSMVVSTKLLGNKHEPYRGVDSNEHEWTIEPWFLQCLHAHGAVERFRHAEREGRVVHVVSTKHPLTWFASLCRWLRQPLASVTEAWLREQVEKHWNRAYTSWLALVSTGRGVLVAYESLLSDLDGTLHRLQQRYGWTRRTTPLVPPPQPGRHWAQRTRLVGAAAAPAGPVVSAADAANTGGGDGHFANDDCVQWPLDESNNPLAARAQIFTDDDRRRYLSWDEARRVWLTSNPAVLAWLPQYVQHMELLGYSWTGASLFPQSSSR